MLREQKAREVHAPLLTPFFKRTAKGLAIPRKSDYIHPQTWDVLRRDFKSMVNRYQKTCSRSTFLKYGIGCNPQQEMEMEDCLQSFKYCH